YDGSSHMLTLQADLTSGAYEKTQWVYGVTTSGGSDYNCNDCLAAVQYPDPSSGNPSSSQQESYTVNALGQNKTKTDRNGAVNTSTTPKVQYAYSEMTSGANHSRPTSMTYPGGRILSYTYASGLDDSISRLSSITDSGTTLESYSYLGLGTVVIRNHPEPG